MKLFLGLFVITTAFALPLPENEESKRYPRPKNPNSSTVTDDDDFLIFPDDLSKKISEKLVGERNVKQERSLEDSSGSPSTAGEAATHTVYPRAAQEVSKETQKSQASTILNEKLDVPRQAPAEDPDKDAVRFARKRVSLVEEPALLPLCRANLLPAESDSAKSKSIEKIKYIEVIRHKRVGETRGDGRKREDKEEIEATAGTVQSHLLGTAPAEEKKKRESDVLLKSSFRGDVVQALRGGAAAAQEPGLELVSATTRSEKPITIQVLKHGKEDGQKGEAKEAQGEAPDDKKKRDVASIPESSTEVKN